MKCNVCKRNIASGAEAQKMIVEYTQSDDTVAVFGYQMPHGPLTAATGRLLRGYHHKCFWLIRKREHRSGDAVNGRSLTGVPTAYEIGDLVITRDEADALGLTDEQVRARSTSYLTDRLTALRELARELGKGVGDPEVFEAYQAQLHGGPYPHTHHLPLDLYQLRLHLDWAHDAETVHLTPPQLHALHGQLHATAAQQAAQAERDSDPGHVEPAERDWRVQHVIDL